jgi:hypothetical protein
MMDVWPRGLNFNTPPPLPLQSSKKWCGREEANMEEFKGEDYRKCRH